MVVGSLPEASIGHEDPRSVKSVSAVGNTPMPPAPPRVSWGPTVVWRFVVDGLPQLVPVQRKVAASRGWSVIGVVPAR